MESNRIQTISFIYWSGCFKTCIVKIILFSFLTLSVAMSIMLDSRCATTGSYLQYACDLLRYFVTKAKDLYGTTFTSYNVHNLVHLHEDIIHFGTSLDNFSCFPFENYLQIMKKFVRKAHNPVSQVAKRVVNWKMLELDIPRNYY